MPGIHDGHRQRLFEKFDKHGFSCFSEHEKLELILFYSIPRHNTNELAHKLLDKYKCISKVLDAPAYELLEFPLITERTVWLFRLFKETFALYIKENEKTGASLCNTDEYASYFMLFFSGITDERLAVLSLNNKGKFLGCEFVAYGDLTSVGVSIRKIMETVLSSKASMVVLCHNHPGGIALPSDADLILTKQIKLALNGIDVYLKDHIIIADGDYVSFALSQRYKDVLQ